MGWISQDYCLFLLVPLGTFWFINNSIFTFSKIESINPDFTTTVSLRYK